MATVDLTAEATVDAGNEVGDAGAGDELVEVTCTAPVVLDVVATRYGGAENAVDRGCCLRWVPPPAHPTTASASTKTTRRITEG